MSELMDSAVIGMPFEMAMSDELSRRQFYSRAQSMMAERDQLRAEVEALRLDVSSLRGSCKALGDDNKHLTRRVTRLAKALGWFSSLQHIGVMKPKWLLAILAKEGGANG